MKKLRKILTLLLAAILAFSCVGVQSVSAETETPLSQFQYYCGFENYTEQIEGISIDSQVASVVTDTYYAGEKALKLSLSDNGITAFELRDSQPFDIASGREYTVSFAYKASADTELYVGMAQAGNVTNTAEALAGSNFPAADDWQTASVTVTPDISSNDGYVMAMLVFTEADAEIYLDDITVSYYSEGAVTLDDIDFGFTADTFPVLNVFNEDNTSNAAAEIWDGTVADTFAGGTGTESDPYLISNGQELALAVTQSGTATDAETSETVNEPYYGSYYKLTADIYLNKTDAIDWKNASGSQSGLNVWYDYSENFAGTIDGDGHTVYGIYYYSGGAIQYSLASGRSGSALIPQSAGENLVKISDLAIDNSYVHDRYNAAAFVANGTANITSCCVGENVKIEGKDIGAFIGRGYAQDFTLSNCCSFATVYGNSYSFYGLVGQVYQSKTTIKNCYNANGPLASYSNGNYSTWYKFYNSYETVASGNATYNDAHNVKTNVYLISDAANMQGTDVLTDESKMPYLALNTDGSANTAFTATEGYPVLAVFVSDTVTDEETGETYEIWDGSTKTQPQDTDNDGVYEITNGEELAYIIYNHGGEGNEYVLTNDIYLNDITKINWSTGDVAIGYTPNSWFGNSYYFEGSIDGAGHTVHGLFYNSAINAKEWGVYGVGLIPRVLWEDTVTVTNLGIDHAYLNSDTGAAAFIGCGGTKNGTPTTYAEITIEQCYAGKDVTVVAHSAGVFRGAGRGSNTYIRNCYSLATVEANGDNGFVAMTWQAPVTIEKSYNANGTLVTSTSNAVTITDSYQTVAGEKTAVTDIANMKGNDVLTNEVKMPLLDSTVFTAATQSFEEYDFYVYLPAGTAFEEELPTEYYNELFLIMDESAVISDGVMKIGAYVKFNAEPDETKITTPAELKEFVRFGSMKELLLTNPYYGVKMDMITKQLSGDDSSVKYVFITDIHYIGGEDVERSVATIKQIENLVEYVNKTDSIDFVAIGGDTIQGTQKKSTSLGYFKKAFTPFLDCNKPVVIVPGNHDDNSYAYNKTSFDGSWLITDKDWNDNIIDVYVNREISDGDTVTVSQDEAVENSKYFYYDLEAKKTRIICLDAIDYEQSYDENGTLTVDEEGNVGLTVRDDSKAVTNYLRYYMATTYWGYGARQMEWLAEEALQAGEDWDYIFISHMGIDEATNFNEGAEITHYGKNLREIITAYQFKTPYVNEELGINADFSETSGRILSYQYGHTHSQKNLYSEDVELWQINSATAQVRDGYFDVMTVSDKKIGRYNIGRGYDETFIQTQSAVSGDVTQDKSVDICDLVKLNLVANGVDNRTTAADIDRNNIFEIISDSAFLRKLLITN